MRLAIMWSAALISEAIKPGIEITGWRLVPFIGFIALCGFQDWRDFQRSKS